uniref:Thrombospondin-like N-terminal domain-containing protein n=1 Tax=Anser brachyrhynchus TaxID=132585 RepID=A0A8B9HZ79_9AVES
MRSAPHPKSHVPPPQHTHTPGRAGINPQHTRLLLPPLVAQPSGALTGWGAVPVDVLQTLGMKDGREGVAVTAGICTRRPGTEDPDFAFRVDNRTQLSAPTRQLFPDSSFPEDFSILATVRAQRGGQAFLLSVYDERGVQQLGVEVGRSPVFLYEDQDGHPAPERYPVFRKVNLADGRWHRVALAVEGTNVSLLVDCHLLATLPLERGPRPVVSTEGVTLFGARLLDEEVFEGSAGFPGPVGLAGEKGKRVSPLRRARPPRWDVPRPPRPSGPPPRGHARSAPPPREARGGHPVRCRPHTPRLSPQGKAGQAGQTGQRGPPVSGRSPGPELGVMGIAPGAVMGIAPGAVGKPSGAARTPQGPSRGQLYPTGTIVGPVISHRDHRGAGYIP